MAIIGTITRNVHGNVDIIIKNSYELTPHDQLNVTAFIQHGASYLKQSDVPCTVNLIIDNDDAGLPYTRIQQLESLVDFPERFKSTVQNKN